MVLSAGCVIQATWKIETPWRSCCSKLIARIPTFPPLRNARNKSTPFAQIQISQQRFRNMELLFVRLFVLAAPVQDEISVPQVKKFQQSLQLSTGEILQCIPWMKVSIEQFPALGIFSLIGKVVFYD